MKRIKFCRYGTLNAYKNSRGQGLCEEDAPSYNAAPERSGIYCFPYGYIETYLVPFTDNGIALKDETNWENNENIPSDQSERYYMLQKSRREKRFFRDKSFRKECMNNLKELYKSFYNKTFINGKKHTKSFVPTYKKDFHVFYVDENAEIYTHLGVMPNIRILSKVGSWNLIKAKDLEYFLKRRNKNKGYDPKDDCEIFIPKRVKIY